MVYFKSDICTCFRILCDNNYAFGKSDAQNESKILRNNLSKKFEVLYARKKE